MDEFEQVLKKHRHEFYGYIYRSVWDSQCADDVFSEAVLAAYKNRRNYKPGTNFRAWMYRIITHKCFAANRETARRPESLDESESLEAVYSEPAYSDVLADPETFLNQCGDEVHIAFKKISTAERACLLLKAVQQFSYKEIAQSLDTQLAVIGDHPAEEVLGLFEKV